MIYEPNAFWWVFTQPTISNNNSKHSNAVVGNCRGRKEKGLGFAYSHCKHSLDGAGQRQLAQLLMDLCAAVFNSRHHSKLQLQLQLQLKQQPRCDENRGQELKQPPDCTARFRILLGYSCPTAACCLPSMFSLQTDQLCSTAGPKKVNSNDIAATSSLAQNALHIGAAVSTSF